MLRAVSSIYIETQTFELFASYRRDVFKLFRTATTSSAPLGQQTVLTHESGSRERLEASSPAGSAPPPPGQAPPPPGQAPPPPPPPPLRRAWTFAAAAVALTASIGGVYFYRRRSEEDKDSPLKKEDAAPTTASAPPAEEPYPADGAQLPEHVQFLLVGGGTASFAAMRALRTARPDARVLIVGDERAPPYMRPPLSKELWREPGLAAADRLDRLSFRQWNGKRRPLAYEPAVFYAPVERLAAGEAGAAAARGWRVTRLDVAARAATLEAAGGRRAVVRYDRCLLATGARARRLPALREAAAAGRALALRGADDAARLARALDAPGLRRVVVVGGGFLACELSAALAARLAAGGGGGDAQVALVFRERAPLAGVLPGYLAAEAARRLRRAGVALLPAAEVAGCALRGADVRLALADGRALAAQLVVECVGAEPEDALGAAAGLERHEALGGLLVNAELAARAGVWAAGDVACFHDPLLGRRRLEHHDHAVVTGRLAGQNMAAPDHLQRPYDHQSMFWSDLGPDLGYEAIGLVDSRLRTVGVFCADAVTEEEREEGAVLREEEGDVLVATRSAPVGEEGKTLLEDTRGAPVGERVAALKPERAMLVKREEGALSPEAEAGAAAEADAAAEAGAGRRYERGVVFYLRDERVVGILLWNLFNRIQLARRVLAQGEFEDLFEVAKLFTPHED